MRLTLLSVLLCARVAAAQPADPPTEPVPPVEPTPPAEPPPPTEPAPAPVPPPAPVQPTTPPPDTYAGRLTVTAERASMHGDCVAVVAIGKRVRQMDPAYYASSFVTNPIIANCRQGVRLDANQVGANGRLVELPSSGPRFESTSEIGIGGGAWAGDFGEALYGPGGPSFGTGKFLNKSVAVTLRVAGATHIEDGAGYLGTIGPHLQVWAADQLWFGAGLGLGVIAACGGGECDGSLGFGLDLRAGYAFKPRGFSGGNVSFEITTYEEGPFSLKTYSLLVGYQSF